MSGEEKGKHGLGKYVRVGIFALVLFVLSTALAEFLPSDAQEKYGAGMSFFQPILAYHYPDLNVRVVDISPLVYTEPVERVDSTGKTHKVDVERIDRVALAKLVAEIDALEPKGIAIDNDFTVAEETPVTGQGEFMELARKLNRPGHPIALGVAKPGINPDDRFMGSEYRPLQASVFIPKFIRFDEHGKRMIGPHWVPWEHRIPYDKDGDGKDESVEILPSIANRLVSPHLKLEPKRGLFFASWARAEELETWEVLIDVSTIPRLREGSISCTRTGELDVNRAIPGSALKQRELAIADQWVVLAAIENAQEHDRFDIPSIGKEVPGGLVHAAAVESLSRGPVRELTTNGTYVLDAAMALLIALLVERIFAKYGGTGTAREFRVDVSWTIAGFVLVMLVAIVAAYLARIVWYGWLSFAFGQLVAFGLKWLFTAIGFGVPAIRKVSRFLFLGSDWK